MRRVKPIHVMAHPNFYLKMEEMRKNFREVNGINLSQTQLTDMLSKSIKIPKTPNLLNQKIRRKKLK